MNHPQPFVRAAGAGTAPAAVIKRWLASPWVQIAACVAVYALVGWRFGKFGVVVTSPLFAAAIALPLMGLVADLRHRLRAEVWLPVHGQHYVYKGTTIHVQEDDDRCRWVPLADVRKVVGTTASERTLAVAFPGRCRALGLPARPCLRDDALVEHLARENNPAALRFRTWVERDIALPGRRVRAGLGIRPEPPDA